MPILANATSRKIRDAAGVLQDTITNVSNGVSLIYATGSYYTANYYFTAAAIEVTVSQGGLQNFVNGSDGSTYYFGNTNGTFDFAINDVVRARFTNAGLQDIWIFKVTSAGALAWAARLTSARAEEVLNFVLGQDDTLYIASQITTLTANFTLTAFFGPLNASNPPTGFVNAGTSVMSPTNQGINGFVSCFNASGTYLATCIIRSTNTVTTTEAAYAVAVDDVSNAVYIGFYAASSTFTIIDFNGTTVTPFSSVQAVTAPADGFIVKLNKFGTTTANTAWCRQIGGSATVDERIADLVLDKNFNLYALVFGKNSLKVYNANNTTYLTVNPYVANQYLLGIVKYDSTGAPQWVIPVDLATSTSNVGKLRATTENLYVIFTCNVATATMTASGNAQTPTRAAYQTVKQLFMQSADNSVTLLVYDFNGDIQANVEFFSATLVLSSFLVYNDEVFIGLRYTNYFGMNYLNYVDVTYGQVNLTLAANSVGTVLVKVGSGASPTEPGVSRSSFVPIICSYSNIF